MVFVHLSWVSLSISRETVCFGSERETLLKLKDDLNDPSNRLSSWNATVNPNCCHWTGVVCNNITSHVTEIHLSTPRPTLEYDYMLVYRLHEEDYIEALEEYRRWALGGEINPCLVDLKHLNYLDLSGNDFQSTPIPSFITKMTSLTHLNLSDAGFMGDIPSQMGNLSNLLYLDLSYVANGTIPPQIGNLSTLIHLDLRGYYYNKYLFHENVDWLSNLPKLCYLDFSNICSRAGDMPIPSFFGSMTTLIHLDLSDSGFMGNIPPQIGNLSNLAYLDLGYAANGTIPSQIGNLSNLLYLDLQSEYPDYSVGRTLFIGNDDWLSSLSKLEYLDLGGANLSHLFNWHHTLQALPSLMHLHLSCTLPQYNQPSFLNLSSLLTLNLSYMSHLSAISFVPKWVFELKKLVSLFLYDNYFEGSVPDGLRNLTLLEYLDLHANSFSSFTPHLFYSSFSHLKLLDLSENNIQGKIPDALGNVTSLVALDLSSNQLESPIPTSFRNLCNLRAIYFSYLKLNQHIDAIFDIITPCISHGLTILDVHSSQLSGNLSISLGKLSSLKTLFLSNNQLSGNPFGSLGSLSKLAYLGLDYNHFEGVVTEDHLTNLTSLRKFSASGNNLTLKVGPNWHPTFQLTYLDMSSWQLGPNFPSWTRSQDKLDYLMMSNTGILDSIPYWFWNTFSQAHFLDLSHNHIHDLASTLKNPISISVVDLSANNLHGKLPSFSNNVSLLDLSSNSFSQSIDDFLCKNQDKPMKLEFLNLASNNLSGEIPDCWDIWPYLVDVNLENNNFVGNIPQSMGSLVELKSLSIRNNSLSGTFPTILKKTNKLILLDLGENKFSGSIPAWVGESLLDMRIFILRSNRFSGYIPNKICDMSLLQVLDLAQNNLMGNIPTCFNSLKAMIQMNKSTTPLIYCDAISNTSSSSSYYTVISVLLWLKGREDEYRNILGLVTSIDLSNNNLVGEIPREITDLNGLIYLNLSHNQLIGHIPQNIGNMISLLAIDFSRNKLSGEIPPTISNLSFLSMLDFSYNGLNGKIPTGTQLQTFDASNFIGNNLCGPPLPINCSSNHKSYDQNGKGSDRHGVNLFYVGMTFGFMVGFWIVVGPLVIYRSWRYVYFHFLDHVWFKLQHFF